jgi:TetR/AcrR family transcriptional regulator, regulator of autoinduction and epiphytic fitness
MPQGDAGSDTNGGGFLDGRVARGVRTRTSIVEAAIALIESGNLRPTSKEVADRAGVSVRLLFHHFEDVHVLYRSAVELQSSRSRSLIGIIPPHGPLDGRIRAICHQRRQLFEAIAPVLRASEARDSNLPGALSDLRALLHHQLAVALRPEILSRGGDAPLFLESLDLAAGWQNWTALRFGAGRSASQAEQVMAYTVTILLH